MNPITVSPDPYDPEAVAIAAELIARSSIVRVRYGSVLQLSPGVMRRLGSGPSDHDGTAVAVRKLSAAEHEWLVAYQLAATRKRREDRERARQERRGGGAS